MDHDAIICSMNDRLTRGPDKDVHVPSVGSQKYPSRGVDVIYLYLTIGGGSIGSNETAITIPGGPRVIDVFYGDGAPSGPNYLLFSHADRLPDALRDRAGVGWSPTPHAAALGAPQRALDPKLGGLGLWPDVWLRPCTDMYLPMEAPAHVA